MSGVICTVSLVKWGLIVCEGDKLLVPILHTIVVTRSAVVTSHQSRKIWGSSLFGNRQSYQIRDHLCDIIFVRYHFSTVHIAIACQLRIIIPH